MRRRPVPAPSYAGRATLKRWVEHIESEPADVWGPQLNTLVDSQLESARSAGPSPEQYRRVKGAGEEWRAEREE